MKNTQVTITNNPVTLETRSDMNISMGNYYIGTEPNLEPTDHTNTFSCISNNAPKRTHPRNVSQLSPSNFITPIKSKRDRMNFKHAKDNKYKKIIEKSE